MKVPFLDLKQQYDNIKNDIEPLVIEAMNSCSYVGGKYVLDFESSISSYLNVKHVISCANGTDALVLALRACGINPGDEVITTPFSFFATAEAIASIGAIPVFVDINKYDYTINPDLIENAITSKTKAILPVHIFGTVCDMDEINSIAKKHGIKVIEDAAQAIGSEYKGNKAGTLGDVGCFSFYPTKNLGCMGDGGMVTTNSSDLSTILKALKEHGAGQNGVIATELLTGIKEELSSDEKVTELYNPYKYYNYLIGYNSRLDAIQAVYLNEKLKHLEKYNSNRTKIANKYIQCLTNKVFTPKYNSDIKPCWHQFAICTEYKNELCDYLAQNDIGCGTFYPIPLHKQKAFNNNNSIISGNCLPVAELVSSQTVCLPIFPEMTDSQIDFVIDTVNNFFAGK